ncbi:ABC transporter substrate-binding protein [Sphingomonas daechungensis]|uniref:ABC transporter substrate-binding protein n=1 Tax=Sphingomonas daechungensis TaxID=1176646 RepID=UPI0037841E3E
MAAGAAASSLLVGALGAHAQKKYDDGATDVEIKIGHTNPYSGAGSSYGVIGKGIDAYWRMVNDRGGIGGHLVKFITLDDGYSPAKTVELVHR